MAQNEPIVNRNGVYDLATMPDYDLLQSQTGDFDINGLVLTINEYGAKELELVSPLELAVEPERQDERKWLSLIEVLAVGSTAIEAFKEVEHTEFTEQRADEITEQISNWLNQPVRGRLSLHAEMPSKYAQIQAAWFAGAYAVEHSSVRLLTEVSTQQSRLPYARGRIVSHGYVADLAGFAIGLDEVTSALTVEAVVAGKDYKLGRLPHNIFEQLPRKFSPVFIEASPADS
jgi:hypothetical protein